MKKQLFMGVLAISLLGGCGHSTIKSDPTSAAQNDVAKMWAAWIKPKGDKFDMNLNIENLSDKKQILIYLSDISCGRGDLKGTVRHTFFNTGERNIQFGPRQAKAFNAVCQMSGKTKGEFTVTVGKIFDNPNGDGKTAGKVIGENLTFRQSDEN